MLRHRTVAASPVRSASAAWRVITDLVADTIATSASLSRAEAQQAMSVAAPAGRMLIAGGHLDRHPLVLVAGLVHCEITTVSGASALATEENLNPIPGATTAEAFTVYLPGPEPLESVIGAAVAGHARLSDAVPVPESSTASSSEPLVDLNALRKAVAER
jgi:hypothetical protein